MKKLLTLVLLVFTIFFSYGQCNYTLTLNDSYGDGWYDLWGNYNGYVSVDINGVNIYNWVLGSGNSGSAIIAVNDGDNLSLMYHSLCGNNWLCFEYENSWELTDCLGNTVWAGTGGFDDSNNIMVDCSVCNPMPVEFLSSSYNCSKELLTWKTASETNNDYFTINVGSEYDKNGLIVEEVQTVYGAGNSNITTSYELNINAKNKYLELYQTDYDGTSILLKTMYQACKVDDKKVILHPNPSNDSVYIDGKYKTIRIYNIIGEESNFTLIDNKISGLNRGFYIVVVDNNYKINLIIN